MMVGPFCHESELSRKARVVPRRMLVETLERKSASYYGVDYFAYRVFSEAAMFAHDVKRGLPKKARANRAMQAGWQFGAKYVKNVIDNRV